MCRKSSDGPARMEAAACFSVRQGPYHEPTVFSVAMIPCPPIWMFRAFFEPVVGEFSGALLCIIERLLPAAAEQRFGRRAQQLPLGVGGDGPDFFDDNVRHQGTRSLTGTFPRSYIFRQRRLKESLTGSMKVRPCARLTQQANKRRSKAIIDFQEDACTEGSVTRPRRTFGIGAGVCGLSVSAATAKSRPSHIRRIRRSERADRRAHSQERGRAALGGCIPGTLVAKPVRPLTSEPF
jgi:hypothetical protein